MAPQPNWQWQYDKANESTETIEPAGRVYQQQFNPDGWLTATIAPNLSTGGAGDATTTTSFGYNLDGIRTSETTSNGGTTTQVRGRGARGHVAGGNGSAPRALVAIGSGRLHRQTAQRF